MREILKRVGTDIRMYHKGLLLAAAYLAAAGLLRIPVCPLVLMTGLPCPGCGMTRAALLFLSGHWRQAFVMHPFFYVLLVLAAAFAVSRYILGHTARPAWTAAVLLLLVAAAIFFYLYRMIRFFPDRAPMVYFPDNLLRLLTR